MYVYISNKAITDGPHVNWKHIDGPLLSWAGSLHWLTLKEKWSIKLGLTTIDAVACARWPYLAQLRDELGDKP